MRRHPLRALLVVSAALATVLGGCGSGTSGGGPAGSTAATACVNAKAAHKAYLVIEHGAGGTMQKCVGFDGDQMNAEDLMNKSGVEYQAQAFTGLGKAVCQVDKEPAQFSECFPKDKPYWALYTSAGGSGWQPAQGGYTTVTLHDGDALGWQYKAATASPPPPPTPKR